MGKIWYEFSDDNGTTWNFANNGQPIAEGYSPSIKNFGRTVVVVYSVEHGLIIKSFDLVSGDFVCKDTEYPEVAISLGDAQPVVNIGMETGYGKIAVVYKYYDKLCLRVCYLTPSSGDIYSIGDRIDIPNTNSNSKNVTLAGLGGTSLHLAWEQYINYYDVEIRYWKVAINSSSNVTFSNYYIPSDGAGFKQNIKPSLLHKNDSSIRLFWVGIPWTGTFPNGGNRVTVRARYNMAMM